MDTGLRFCRKAGWEIEEIMLIRFSEDFKGVCYHCLLYTSTNVMAGRTGEYNKERGNFDNVIYMPCTEAVSYTHLDVYKRQVYENEMANVSIHELKEAMTIRVKGILHEEERAPHGLSLIHILLPLLSSDFSPSEGVWHSRYNSVLFLIWALVSFFLF